MFGPTRSPWAKSSKNRGGRPRVYNRETVLIEALVYVGSEGVPDTLEGEGGLAEKVELALQERNIRVPGKTQLADILRNAFNRLLKIRAAKRS
jgi:hypothetical protein